MIFDEGGLAILWFFLTRGGWGVGQFLILADKGGRGGLQTPNFGWHHMWTTHKDQLVPIGTLLYSFVVVILFTIYYTFVIISGHLDQTVAISANKSHLDQTLPIKTDQYLLRPYTYFFLLSLCGAKTLAANHPKSLPN